MAIVKGTVKVHHPSCGHEGPIEATVNTVNGEWVGRCSQCGAPAKIEMELVNPDKGAHA